MIKRKGGSTSLSLFLCSIISLLLSSLFPSVTHFTFFSFHFSLFTFSPLFLCYFFLYHPQEVKQFCAQKEKTLKKRKKEKGKAITKEEQENIQKSLCKRKK